MFWNRYFFPSILLMLLVVTLHWVASFKGLYWTLDWYDILMHFLGGLWVFVFMLWVMATQYAVRFKKLVSIRNLLLFTLLVGVLWEVHEIVLGFTSFSDVGYTFDTILDLVMDMLGAVFGACIYKNQIGK